MDICLLSPCRRCSLYLIAMFVAGDQVHLARSRWPLPVCYGKVADTAMRAITLDPVVANIAVAVAVAVAVSIAAAWVPIHVSRPPLDELVTFPIPFLDFALLQTRRTLRSDPFVSSLNILASCLAQAAEPALCSLRMLHVGILSPTSSTMTADILPLECCSEVLTTSHLIPHLCEHVHPFQDMTVVSPVNQNRPPSILRNDIEKPTSALVPFVRAVMLNANNEHHLA